MMSGATGESLAIPETPDPLRRGHHRYCYTEAMFVLTDAQGKKHIELILFYNIFLVGIGSVMIDLDASYLQVIG